jgi:hypothetical protein
MDKQKFVEEAPAFYTVAIAFALLEGKREVYTIDQIKEALPVLSRSLIHDPLMEAGLNPLITAGVVGIAKEAFGPPVYHRLPSLTKEWAYSDACDQIPVFRTFAQVRNWAWLVTALREVNEHYVALSIIPEDFKQAVPSLWEPLPLDRTDEGLIAATEAVDEAITKIEADNGYAANVPGERDYVLQSLKTFRTTLRESAQITGMQIKTFAIDPLNVVMKRFAENAVGVVAGAAKDAVVTWLKSKFGALIAWLLF